MRKVSRFGRDDGADLFLEAEKNMRMATGFVNQYSKAASGGAGRCIYAGKSVRATGERCR